MLRDLSMAVTLLENIQAQIDEFTKHRENKFAHLLETIMMRQCVLLAV